MKYIITESQYNRLLNESSNNIINKSFNLTINDINEIIGYLEEEYKNDYKYYTIKKNELINLLKTSFSINEYGELIGIENFPESIKLYRIIDSININKECLGRYWTYDKNNINSEEFFSSVGFDKNKEWSIIEATFKKEDIDIYDTIFMLLTNPVEREIRLKSKCTQPINFSIYIK